MSTTSMIQVRRTQRRVSLTMDPESYDRLGILARHEKRSRGAEASYLIEKEIAELGGLKKIGGRS